MSTASFEMLNEIVDKAIIQVGPSGSRYVIEETLFHRAREVSASSTPPSDPDAEALRARASRCYAGDDVQIDSDAAVSMADDGAWVAAWVWLSNDDMLAAWRVTLHEERGDEFTLVFDCMAEDADHAAEQAENAYPGCEVINCTLSTPDG